MVSLSSFALLAYASLERRTNLNDVCCAQQTSTHEMVVEALLATIYLRGRGHLYM
jgi:hypothetical protein